MATTRKTKRRREDRREPEPREHWKAPPTPVLVAFGGLIVFLYVVTDLRWGTVMFVPMLVGALITIGIGEPSAPRWLRAVGKLVRPFPASALVLVVLVGVFAVGLRGATAERAARELAEATRPAPRPDLPKASPTPELSPIALSDVMVIEGKHPAASTRAKLMALFALAKQNDQAAGERMMREDPDMFWAIPGTKVNVIADGTESIVQVRERGTANTFWIIRDALVSSR